MRQFDQNPERQVVMDHCLADIEHSNFVFGKDSRDRIRQPWSVCACDVEKEDVGHGSKSYLKSGWGVSGVQWAQVCLTRNIAEDLPCLIPSLEGLLTP